MNKYRKVSYDISFRDKIILFALHLWLCIDMLNGLFLRIGIPIPISQIYKAALLVYIIISSKVSKITYTSFFLCLYVFLWGCIVSCIGSDFIISITAILKPLTTYIIFLYLVSLLKNTKSPDFIIEKFISIFKVNLIIFSANILLGLLGIGYSSYGGDQEMGYCGFFYSPNELSGVVAVLFPLALTYIKIYRSQLEYILAIIIFAVIAILLGTKAPIIVFIASILLITYFYGSIRERYFVVISGIVLIICAVIYVNVILSIEAGIIQRLQFFIEKNGVWNALTSGRLLYWQEEKYELSSAGVIGKLIGLGGARTVEMDPQDLLLNCGYIGFTVLMILYYKLLMIPLRVKNIYSRAVFVSNSLLVFMSIISGHIFFSSMAGLFIALSNSLLFYKPFSSSDIVYTAK